MRVWCDGTLGKGDTQLDQVMAGIARDTVDHENVMAAAAFHDVPFVPSPPAKASPPGDAGVSLLEISELLGRHPVRMTCYMSGDSPNSEMRTTYMSVDVFCHMLQDMNFSDLLDEDGKTYNAASAVYECLSDPLDLADVPAVITFAGETWELEPMIETNITRISMAIRELAVGLGLEVTEYPVTTRLRWVPVMSTSGPISGVQYLLFDSDFPSPRRLPQFGLDSDAPHSRPAASDSPVELSSDSSDDDAPARYVHDPFWSIPTQNWTRSSGTVREPWCLYGSDSQLLQGNRGNRHGTCCAWIAGQRLPTRQLLSL